MSVKWSAFRDAVNVSEDVAAVAKCFSNVPSELVSIGKDAFSAVLHGDVSALQGLGSRVQSLSTTATGDLASAGPAFDSLKAHFAQLIADL